MITIRLNGELHVMTETSTRMRALALARENKELTPEVRAAIRAFGDAGEQIRRAYLDTRSACKVAKAA